MNTTKQIFLAFILCVIILITSVVIGALLFGHMPNFESISFGILLSTIFFVCRAMTITSELPFGDEKNPAKIAPHHGETSMHVYFFNSSEPGLLCELWTHSVPDNDEKVILWDKGEGFSHYKVAYRIYGANIFDQTAAWNIYIYVKKITPTEA